MQMKNLAMGLSGRALLPNTVEMRSGKSPWMSDIVSTVRQGKMFKGLRSPQDDYSSPCGDVRPAPAGPMTKAHAENAFDSLVAGAIDKQLAKTIRAELRCSSACRRQIGEKGRRKLAPGQLCRPLIKFI